MERDSQEREPALDHDKADYLIRRGTTRFMGQGSVKSVGCASNIPLIGRGNPVFEPARTQRSKCNFDCPLIHCTATIPSCFVPLRISVKRESFLTLLLCEIFPISNLNDSFEATKKKGKMSKENQEGPF